MDKYSPYIQIFSECPPIKGYCRSAIYDLPRHEFKFMPLDLYEILMTFEGKRIEDVKKKYNSDKNMSDIIDEYFGFLDEHDFIFYCDFDEIELFPKLDLTWDYPAIISNVFFEIKNIDNKFIENSISIVNFSESKDILLKLSFKIDITLFEVFLSQFNGTKIKCIDIFINHKENKENFTQLKEIVLKFPRIRSLIFFNSTVEKTKKGYSNFGNVIQTKKDILNESSSIDKSYFNVNMSNFTESQLHNTYFNRKLYIGTDGEIKNAPECEQSFGTIDTIKDKDQLKDIIDTPQFQKYWYVHKEVTDVCKDCEFRHMCVDNRVPTKRTNNEWYHTQECNYNPYISKWKDEEGYQTLSACGVISNEKGFSIDHERIAAINEALWVEE